MTSPPETRMNTNSQTNQISQSIAPRVARSALHPAELLSYSTVRLTCIRTNMVSLGTGFFYDIPHPTNPHLHIPVIVSNRHVSEAARMTCFTFTLETTDHLPSSELYSTAIDNGAVSWIDHPDPSVDLSVLPIATVLDRMRKQGKFPFYSPLTPSLVPDDEYLKSVTQTDEVIMIGYPGALWDEVNNQPIFRKGTLATSPRKDFRGRHEFLIDMPVFHGSSGSPVLLFSDGMYYDREHGVGMQGRRIKLLGINFATIKRLPTGKVVPVPIPTVVEDNEEESVVLGSETDGGEQGHFSENQMETSSNIGVVIRASRLKEFEVLFSSLLRESGTNP